MTLYRIVLVAEDRRVVLGLGYRTIDEAGNAADQFAVNYGEGQTLHIEPYYQ